MHTPLSKDIDWFLEYLAARPASPRTISTYRSSLAHLLRFAVNRGCTSADQLTDDLVRAAAVDLMRRAAVALAENERARAKGNEGAARLMVGIGRGAPEAVGRVVVAAAQLARWVGACGAGYCSSGIGWHSPPRLGASNTKPPQLEDDVLEPGGLRRAPARGRAVARMLVARGCHDKAAVTSRSQFPTSVVVSARSTAASMCLANASVWSPGSGRRFSRRKVTPTM